MKMKKEENEKKVTKKGNSSKKESEVKKNVNQEKKLEKKANSKEKSASVKKSSAKVVADAKVEVKGEEKKKTKKEKATSLEKKEKVEVKEEKNTSVVVDEDLVSFSDDDGDSVKEKKTKGKIKKSDLILIVGLVVVAILGFVLMNGGKEEASYELPLQLIGDSGLQLLSYQEYQDKIDQNESFVVVLSRESCSHCANFLPVAKKFAEDKKLPMYYVDTDTFSDEDWNSFEKSNTFLKKNASNWGTPTTIVLAGKTAVDYIEGETDEDSLMNLYNQYFDMNQE